MLKNLSKTEVACLVNVGINVEVISARIAGVTLSELVGRHSNIMIMFMMVVSVVVLTRLTKNII